MIKKILVCTALLGAFSGAAFAIPANATFGFFNVGTVFVNDPGNDLLASTTITLPAFELINTVPSTNFGNNNDFFCGAAAQCFVAGDTLTLNPLTLSLTSGPVSLPDMLIFSTNLGGRYHFSATSSVVSFDANTHSAALYFLGTFHDTLPVDPNPLNPQPFDDGPASLSFSFTQSAADSTINSGATFSTPPAPPTGAPEPATTALLGSALVGLGLIGRKKLAR